MFALKGEKMKEVEEFKNKNGGTISYSIKELLGALHIKIDKVNDNLTDYCKNNDKKIATLETTTGIIVVILIGIVTKLFFF